MTRDESASIVVIAGANCDGKEVRQLAEELSKLARLLKSGLGIEHVEQITGDANQVEVWSFLDRPSQPVGAEVKV